MSAESNIPHDPVVAARLLIACIEEPEVLAVVPELEIDDFYEWHHKAVFEAVRNLQANGHALSLVDVDRHLRINDAKLQLALAPKCGIEFLAKLNACVEPYAGDVTAAIADAKRLRYLRTQREYYAANAPREDAAETASENTFSTMPSRIVGERDRRAHLAARALNYHNTFFDDVLRAILPHDLILIGAETGLGKTDLALSIAMANATSERPTGYFALEAEPDELERRTKYSWLSREAHRRQLPSRNELNFTDWYLCRCEHIVGELNAECDEWFLRNLGGFWSFYRGERFDQNDLRREILKIHKLVDLIVVDHLHYVDIEDGDSEGHGIGETMKAIRDVSLRIGKPVVLVAHLRKRDERLKKIVPSIGDFHGSSNISKVCTQAITIARARKVKAPKWWLAPTYMSVLKDRRAGAPPYVALQFFDRRSRTYEENYVLGELTKADTDWEALKPGDPPSWARGHRQLELEFV